MSTFVTEAATTPPTPDVADLAPEPERDAAREELRAGTYAEGEAALSPEEKEEKEAERVAAARVAWEKALGEAIGSKAFEAIREHVSVDDLQGYAQKGVDALLAAGVDLLQPTGEGALGGLMDEAKEAEAARTFAGALTPILAEAAAEWLASDSGQAVLRTVSQWVEEHPATVATAVGVAAIGAAVAAYLSNMEIPELKQTFNLGRGFSAEVAAELGRLQEIAVQTASATVRYQGEGVQASLGGSYSEEGGVTVTAAAATEHTLRGGGTLTSAGTVTVTEDGATTIDVNGGLTRTVAGTPLEVGLGARHAAGGGSEAATDVNASVAWGEEGERTSVRGTWNPGTEAFSLTMDRSELEGRLLRSYGMTRGEDGSLTRTTASSYQLDEQHTMGMRAEDGPDGGGSELSFARSMGEGGGLAMDAAVGTGTMAGGRLGLDYQRDAFKGELDLAMSEGVSTLGIGASYGEPGDVTAEASASFNLSESRIEELGLKLGWRDPDAFRSWMVQYRGEWMANHDQMAHHFDGAFEYAVGRVSGRMTGGLDLSGSTLMGSRADLLLGYDLNPDWKVLGGGGYEGVRATDTAAFEGHGYLRGGLQYKDVAITATYQPDGNTWGLGITIPLGRR